MGPLTELASAWVHPVNGEPAFRLATNAKVGRDARSIAKV
jgi:2-amino-4-hydroxy-6-hydroxymethyldihydropteridine diphosphokinase